MPALPWILSNSSMLQNTSVWLLVVEDPSLIWKISTLFLSASSSGESWRAPSRCQQQSKSLMMFAATRLWWQMCWDSISSVCFVEMDSIESLHKWQIGTGVWVPFTSNCLTLRRTQGLNWRYLADILRSTRSPAVLQLRNTMTFYPKQICNWSLRHCSHCKDNWYLQLLRHACSNFQKYILLQWQNDIHIIVEI